MNTFVILFKYRIWIKNAHLIDDVQQALTNIFVLPGLLPKSWRQQIPMLRMGSESSLLVFFPETHENAANIMWAHGINTEEKLLRALYSSKSNKYIDSYRGLCAKLL